MVYTFHKISDVKNRAKKIARDEKLPRHKALNEAANRGGFQNYAHALKELPEAGETARYTVEIRQRWRDRETKQRGTVAVSVTLQTRLTELVKPHQLVEELGGCTIDGESRLINDGFMRNREASQNDVSRVARALQFMDATGLKPSRARKCYPRGNWENRPPIADHDSCWFDPTCRVHILTTQPYPGRANAHREEQFAWEKRHSWETVRSDWGSLYGFGTELYLLCPSHYTPELQERVSRLESSPAAITHKLVTDFFDNV